MNDLTKRLSAEQLAKLSYTDDPHIKRLIWEVAKSRFLLGQIRRLLDHWGDEDWQTITIRDFLIEKLDDQ